MEQIPHNKLFFDNVAINEMIVSYKNGISLGKIGELFNVDRTTIKRILIENNSFIIERDIIKKNFTDADEEKIINLYLNDNLSCHAISKMYKCSKGPINNILKNNDILRKGRSDGVKINLTNDEKEIIKRMYLEEYKNNYEISNETGLNKHFIDKYLGNSGFRRNKSEGVSVGLVKRFGNRSYDVYLKNLKKYKKYRSEVMMVTNRQPINNLPNHEKRGISGRIGAYHLDHKFSIMEGFKCEISPEIIGGIKNLEFISWEENTKKRTKCSINKEELINIK